MTRKVLVLGGTRFFGKQLIKKLITRGDEITIVSRGIAADPFGSSIQRLTVDREDQEALRSALNGGNWDIVYDQICYAPSDAEALCKILKGHVGRFIFTSTQSVYLTNHLQIENSFDPYHYPIKLGHHSDFTYGEGKRLAEAVYFQVASFPVIAVRIPFVLGADDYTGRLNFHIDRIQRQKSFIVPNIDALTSVISSTEAASFLEWIGGQEFHGPINACSLGEIKLRDIIETIEQALGKKAIVVQHGNKEDQSPYATENSRYLDSSKAINMGFKFSHWNEWLPNLVAQTIRQDGAQAG